MTPETPAQGILKHDDWGDSKWYTVTCNCTDPDHAHTIEVSADDDDVTVHIYSTVKSRFWERNRWRQIWQILCKGYAEYEVSAILKPQAAVNYAKALTSAAEDVIVFKNQRLKQRAENTDN